MRDFLLVVIAVCLGGCLFCGGMAISDLNTQVKELQTTINYNNEQVDMYIQNVGQLQKSVDDCEEREQNIINNVLNNW